MISVAITPQFRRMFKKLECALQTEALEKIELLKDDKNHKQLRIHKLKGVLKNQYSFSVNYKTRIVFMYETKTRNSVILVAVSDHDVYK